MTTVTTKCWVCMCERVYSVRSSRFVLKVRFRCEALTRGYLTPPEVWRPHFALTLRTTSISDRSALFYCHFCFVMCLLFFFKEYEQVGVGYRSLTKTPYAKRIFAKNQGRLMWANRLNPWQLNLQTNYVCLRSAKLWQFFVCYSVLIFLNSSLKQVF